MSNTKRFALACASILVIAASMPALAQDEQTTDPFKAFVPEQADTDVVAPAAEEAQAPVDQPSVTDLEADDKPMDVGAPAAAPAGALPLGTQPTPKFLEDFYAKQNEIALKRLDVEIARLKSEESKLQGEIAPPVDPTSGQPVVAAPVEPEDDPSTLPAVSAVMGAKGTFKAELRVNGGGMMVAAVGDMVPGGWKISRIEKGAVYAVSARTGDEYLLASTSAPEGAAQVKVSMPANMGKPAAPKVEEIDPADSDIIVAPAQ